MKEFNSNNYYLILILVIISLSSYLNLNDGNYFFTNALLSSPSLSIPFISLTGSSSINQSSSLVSSINQSTSSLSALLSSSMNDNSSNTQNDIVEELAKNLQETKVLQEKHKPKKKIPITVLSGFLGSGKTTLLQFLLNNSSGEKIAVIVNDVASVNIDESLIVGRVGFGRESNNGDGEGEDEEGRPAGIVQLSNGCACCSLSGELLGSVSELVTLSDLRGQATDDEDVTTSEGTALTGPFDHIVIELSGVSEPRAIRANFQEAVEYNMPLMDRVQLDTMVNVIDCSTFLEYLKDGEEDVTVLEASKNPSRKDDYNNDDDDKYLPDLSFLDPNPNPPTIPSNYYRGGGVSDLLVEGVEVADVIILNKIDTLNDDNDHEDNDQLKQIETIVETLNSRATVTRTSFGSVSIDKVLAVANGEGASGMGVVDDHRDAVKGASSSTSNKELSSQEEKDTLMVEVDCTDPGCNDINHSHDHIHSHENAHEHDDQNNHKHDKKEDSSCTDSNCNDPTHSHSHDHHHESNPSINEDQSYKGIGSYVYRARRPFHPNRLLNFLRRLPIKRGLPPPSDNDNLVPTDTQPPPLLHHILRSKGFCWLADSNRAALYWSHAGPLFEMQCLGRWWSTLPREDWPDGVADTVLQDYDDIHHMEPTNTLEPIMGKTVGDRRQELVLIGIGMNDPYKRNEVRMALDQCLLQDGEEEKEENDKQEEVGDNNSNDKGAVVEKDSNNIDDEINSEMNLYRKSFMDDSKLRAIFPSPLGRRVVSF